MGIYIMILVLLRESRSYFVILMIYVFLSIYIMSFKFAMITPTIDVKIINKKPILNVNLNLNLKIDSLNGEQ